MPAPQRVPSVGSIVGYAKLLNMARVLPLRPFGMGTGKMGTPGVVGAGDCTPNPSLYAYQTPMRPAPGQMRPVPSSISSMSGPQGPLPAAPAAPAPPAVPDEPLRPPSPPAVLDPAPPPCPAGSVAEPPLPPDGGVPPTSPAALPPTPLPLSPS